MDVLDRALERGLITREQYDAIRALDEPTPGAPEAPRGFNWISVAYFAGALIVIFALGWFLADQWEDLGASGVLVVSLAYAALFIAIAWKMLRDGYRTAGGLATALAVATTPLIFWAIENLTGLWSPWRAPVPFTYHGQEWESGRWTIIQLATIGSALFALKRVRFPFLTAFIAVPFITMALPLTELLFGDQLGGYMAPWTVLLFGTLLIAAGYALDRSDDEREGFAFWFYLCGTCAIAYGVVSLVDQVRWTRHLAPLLAITLFAASLYLRQRVFMVAGALTLFAYLAYLAADVFEDTALFPIALAAIGLLILLSTVWLQRTYPKLVRRVGGDRAARPALPGGMITVLIPVALAIAVVALRYPAELSKVREYDRSLREMRRLEASEQRAEEMRRRQQTAPRR
ncbi:MAG TPA: DUF2157 domain-containing protein [Gemmatimonadaceae bacterium]|nr:DUF2157 domain-containing protein [Gemmatimonadaceae bacterium]